MRALVRICASAHLFVSASVRARLLACIPRVCVRACAPSTRAVIASGCCRPPTHTAPSTPPHPIPPLWLFDSAHPCRPRPCRRLRASPSGPPGTSRRSSWSSRAACSAASPAASPSGPPSRWPALPNTHAPPPPRAHTQTIHTQRTHTNTGTHAVWLFRLSVSLVVCLCVCVSALSVCVGLSVGHNPLPPQPRLASCFT